MAHVIRRLDFKGKGRIIQRIRSEAMRREVTADCGGILYRLDLADDVQRELYFNQYEKTDIRQLLALVPVGGTCLDVGANNGAFALQMARKVGEKGVVHAFEPDREVFIRLQYNCRLNGFEDRLHCHNIAVTNRTGPLSFYSSAAAHSGWGSLVRFGDIAVQTQEVEGIKLDDFMARESIRRVDVLKIDVEAHEPELLEGAQASLAAGVFRFVLIEFNGIRLAERGKTLEDFLRPFLLAGYKPAKLRLDLLKKMQAGVVPSANVCVNFLFEAGN
jgi:FkbM family methyltransferase